ncbi:hypothetical protein Tco_0248035 [Tanacetum coccineum]
MAFATSSQTQQPKQLTRVKNVHFEVEDGVINFNNGIALLESQNTSYHPMLQFIKNNAAAKTISFTLSCFDKTLSFDHGVFSSVIGLKPSENCILVPPKETVKAGLATLGLFDEKHPHLSSTDLINSSPVRIKYFSPKWRVLMQYIGLEIDISEILFSDLIASLHPPTGKPERKANIFYTRYLSLIMENLLKDAYKNENLMSLKPHNITATIFKPTLENEIALTAHMCKVAALSPDLIKSLIPPSREVNADDTADKSSSRTSMQPVTQSKAPTVRRPRKKKIPSSTQPKALESIRESSPTTQVAETQPAEETVATADATKSLDASELAEEQVNQPKTAEAEKVLDQNNQEEVKESGLESMGDPRQPDDAQIMFLGAEPYHFDYDQTKSTMHVDYDSNFGLRSMPDDDLVSLTGFETPDSDDNDSQEGTAKTFNASTDMPAQSDLFDHLLEELRTLSTKVDQLESSISKKVTDDIQSFMPSIVVDALKANLHGLLSEALKNTLPHMIKDFI